MAEYHLTREVMSKVMDTLDQANQVLAEASTLLDPAKNHECQEESRRLELSILN
jgi:hypothetical protein